MSDDDQEAYAQRLRRRLTILKEELEAGKVHFNPDLEVIESLKAVRYGADGEIDLATVDASVRSLALAVEAMRHRQETKKVISLSELQRGYFENIDSVFGGLYADMKRQGLTPFQVGSGVASDPEGRRLFHKAIPGVIEWVTGLWEEADDVALVHAQDIFGLKSVFGGETFPQRDVVSCTGIYVDTNILPDPFLRSGFFLKGPDQTAAVRTFVTSGLSLLRYKDAATTDLEVPLAAIIPDYLFLNEQIRERVFKLAESDTVSHLSAIFGIQFNNLQEADEWLGRLSTPDDVARKLANPSLLLFDVDDVGPVQENIKSYIDTYFQPFGYGTNAGKAVLASIIGRMRQANDLLFRSTQLCGSPLIDAPTSWRYFNWKLGYGTTQRDPSRLLNLHMSKALQNAASGQMEWLGAVPVDALVEMRKQNVLPELRSILSKGINELIELRPDNYFRTGDQVVENIQSAFDEHRKKLASLTGKKWRFAGVELASCIVKGAVQVASACGVPVVSLVGAALDQATDVPKLKDIPKRFKAIRDEARFLNDSAVGILFEVARKQS